MWEGEYKLIQSLMVLGLLGISSVEDLRTKKVSVVYLMGFGLLAIYLQMRHIHLSLPSVLGGAALGLVFLGITIIRMDAMGLGDGLVLTIVGIFLGFRESIEIMVIAIFLTAIYALFLILVRKKDKQTEIAFIPFLFISFILVWIYESR